MRKYRYKNCPRCLSKEICLASKLCKSCSNSFRKGIKLNGNTGRYKHGPISEEHKRAISIANSRPKTEKEKRNISLSLKGNVPWNKGLKGFNAGDKHGNWKGGITPINLTIRQSFEYKHWRTSVFKRDNFACVWCGSNVNIEADHIKQFAFYPELRFSLDNGRTLCRDCHKKTDTYKNRVK